MAFSATRPSANNSNIVGVHSQNKQKHAKYETAKTNTDTKRSKDALKNVR